VARPLRDGSRPRAAARAGGCDGRGGGRLLVRVEAAVPDRAGLVRGAGRCGRAGGDTSALRQLALEGAAGARDRAGPQRRRAEPAAGLPARDTRRDPAAHSREPGAVRPERHRLLEGERLVMGDLAGTLERLAEHGAADLYTGELGRALSEHVLSGGGGITMRDLAEYRVIQRRPVKLQFLGHEFESNPPPSTGGILIGLGLRLLDRLGVAGAP